MASERREQPNVGVPEIDAEHALQLELVDAFRAAAAGTDASGTAVILEQLEDYTNAHFVAEQLLMRLHAYPAYADHVQEHDRLVAELASLRRAWAGGVAGPALEVAARLRGWLLQHIETADQVFAAYLRDSRSTSRDPGPA